MLTPCSFTTSLDSSVTNYKYEHGRRYHAYQDGKYVLPNDEAEINRLGMCKSASQIALRQSCILEVMLAKP